MKNPTESQRTALQKRAEAVARRLGASCRQGGGLSPGGRAAVEREAARILRGGRAVGASLVLVQGGREEVFCFGLARRRPRMPVTPETCFRVASVTKTALALGFLAAAERGLLALDADISALLGYKARNPRFPDSPVTPRMLLTHTAGLRDEGPYLALDPERPPALREFLRDAACWTDTAPGASFRYSNLGAGVAGVVLERALNLPLDEAMRVLLFDSLGIRAALDPRRISPTRDLACGYRVYPLLPPRLRYDAPRLAARPSAPFDPERDVFAGAGRMLTDSHGAAALLRLLCQGADTPALSSASLREMYTLQDGKGGVRLAGRTLGAAALPGVFPGFAPFGHQGVAYGMCAELFFDPAAGCGAALMTSGLRLDRRAEPLVAPAFDLLALAFSALRAPER